jgi:predicted O-linked N-acetylglucosamine transferase (SPINDLY family)
MNKYIDDKDYDKVIQLCNQNIINKGYNTYDLFYLGVANYFQNKMDESLSNFNTTLSMIDLVTFNQVSLDQIYMYMGHIKKHKNDIPLAIKYYKKSIKCNNKNIDSIEGLCNIYKERDYEFYIMYLCLLLKHKKNDDLYYELYTNLFNIGASNKAFKIIKKIKKMNGCELLKLNSCSDLNYVTQKHFEVGKSIQEKYIQQNKWNNELKKNKIINIGLISAEFCNHACYNFYMSIINYIPKNVKVICYYNGTTNDSNTEIIKSKVFKFTTVYSLQYDEIRNVIKNDKIDILIEMAGYTNIDILNIIGEKPAPIQISWLAYPNTTGLKSIDYRFTDKIADPLESQQQYTEKLYRLPNSFICYKKTTESITHTCVSDRDSTPNIVPYFKNKYITFCSNNALHKITNKVLKLWGNILKNVSGSKLFIKVKEYSDYEKTSALCENINNIFKKYEIEKNRWNVICNDVSNPFLIFSMSDIHLDTFPYSGTTTTFNALTYGLPTITYYNKLGGHAHNVSASILNNIDCVKEFITTSKVDYIKKAIDISKNPNKLIEIRKKLFNEMNLIACNEEKFSNNFYNACANIWNSYVENI